ncbi:MAG TPA: hypothetical protein VM925_27645 [Labilithrix sp.]|nr:hypothetical protein [Labilithrix sp.]
MNILHDDDFEALHVPFAAKLAGSASLLFGATALALAAQTLLMVRPNGMMIAGLVGMLVLGSSAAVAGFGALRGRYGAVIASLALGGLGAMAFGAWGVLLLGSRVVSPLSWATLPCALGTALTSALAIEPARKLAAARQRMRERGLDLGI